MFLVPRTSSTRLFRALLFLAFACVLGIGVYGVEHAQGSDTGQTGSSRSGCTTCHGATAKPATTVYIATDEPKIEAGKAYTFRIVVKNPSQVAAGCDISVSGGRLDVSGTGLRRAGGELTHSSPRTFTGDSAMWTFKFTAPTTPGTYKIYAAGNAVNGNGRDDAGDAWNITTYTVTVVASSGPVASLGTVPTTTTYVGSPVERDITLQNTGATTLTVQKYAIRSGAQFAVLDTSAHALNAGESFTVKVNFSPKFKGTFVDSLQIWTDGGYVSTPLRGTALISKPVLTATWMAFDTTASGASSSKSVTLKNSGDDTLILSAIQITGSGFTAETAGLPITVPPGTNHDIVVHFAPTTTGQQSATLTATVGRTAALGDTDLVFELIGFATPSAGVVEAPRTSYLVLYPNPATSFLRVTGEAGSHNVLAILDAEGRSVGSASGTTLAEGDQLDVRSLASGSYSLLLQNANGEKSVLRFVITR